MKYRLGLKPVVAQPRLRLVDFLRPVDLPSVESLPKKFGHADLIEPRMFMNDELGCCAESGSIEEVRLINATRGVEVNFDDAAVVQNYHEAAGYDPNDASTDQGTDVHQLFEYRQSKGILDADGKRHTVVAWAGLTPGDFDELLVALRLFEVVGVGIQVPDYAEAQFEAGQSWHLVKGRHNLVGGHYIPAVQRDGHAVEVFTWGGRQVMEGSFYHALSNVAVVAFTEEMLNGDKTIDGFDREKLTRALSELNTGPVMAKAPRSKRPGGDKAKASRAEAS